MVQAVNNTAQFPTPGQGEKRHGRQNRPERRDRSDRPDRQAAGDKAPAPLKFKISMFSNEAGKGKVKQMVELCDFATLFAKAKQMCAENAVPEAECKLSYK